MKRFREHRFHTHFLIPWEVAQKALSYEDEDARREEILLWIETKRNTVKYSQGSKVANTENLSQMMIVDRVIRKSNKAKNKEFVEEDNSEKAKQDRNDKQNVIGIDCHWFEDVFPDFM